MKSQRQVEIFSAGCPICQDTINLVNQIACPSCTVSVFDTNDSAVAQRANELGVRSVPAVAIDGTLAACCTGKGVSEKALRAAGIGQS